MDIEILEQARFSASGNSVLKMMPNKSIPLLDLLVRESIQNSLDAQIPNAKEVKVDIRHGSFDIDSLANYIEKIGSKLRRYTHNQFISIRDSNTIGLIGNLDGNYKKNEKSSFNYRGCWWNWTRTREAISSKRSNSCFNRFEW